MMNGLCDDPRPNSSKNPPRVHISLAPPRGAVEPCGGAVLLRGVGQSASLAYAVSCHVALACRLLSQNAVASIIVLP